MLALVQSTTAPSQETETENIHDARGPKSCHEWPNPWGGATIQDTMSLEMYRHPLVSSEATMACKKFMTIVL